MKSFQRFFITLTCMLFIFYAKSQWIPCQGIEGASCQSITVQDSFLFIDGNGGIYRRLINDPAWDSACLIGGFMKIRSTGNTLFCYGGSTMSSLYRSIDNGFTWEYMDFDYEYRNIENVNSVIFLDTYNNGLLRSTDEGENWTLIDPSPVSAEINWVYSQQGILYSYLEDVDSLYLSMDYGDTWTVCPLTGISGEVGQAYMFEQNLWITKGNNFYIFDEISGEWYIQNDSLPSTVWMSYLIEDQESLCCFTNDGYYRFNQEDSVWEDESQGLENLWCSDACLHDNTIYLATASGPFSKTGNAPWIPQYDDLFGFSVSQVFDFGSRIYALAKGKIFFSDNLEEGFEIQETEGYCTAHKIITHSSGWFEGSDCGFSISTDSGYTWTNFNNGLENYHVRDIARTNLYYYAMVRSVGVGLFRSKTYSNDWERVPNELGTMNLSDIDVLDNVLFAAGNNVLYRSDDFGTTFESVPEAGNGSYLYIKNNKVFFFSNTEIRYSTDVGITWQTWISGIVGADIINCMEITDSEDTTVVGGFVGPWNPVPYLNMFTPQNPQGVDIRDNLPLLDWSAINYVFFDHGRLFACPSSGGLWYRDDLAVGIKDNKPSNAASYSQLSIHPNPAKDIIRIHQDKNIEKAEYQVIDYSGKLIMKGIIETGMDNFSLDVSNLSDGIYLIMIRDNDQINSSKFIKAD